MITIDFWCELASTYTYLAAHRIERLAELGLVAPAEEPGALRRSTEEAIRLGIFGAPTFMVGDEMFWGNDRLERALAWARR